MNKTNHTPMVRQYLEIKQTQTDKILFFRLGDFYEMFFEDAELVAKELDLVLTGRGKNENRVPMCGIPYHALDNYLPRLINKGYKVAICEQVEDPQLAKGLTKREVVRVITPGTILESNLLDSKKNNYLMAISKKQSKSDIIYGIAVLELSTGEFKVTEAKNKSALLSEIARIEPKEILLPKDLKEELTANLTVYNQKDELKAQDLIKDYFKVKSLEAFGLNELSIAKSAILAVIEYLQETKLNIVQNINKISVYNLGDYMFLDKITRKNLEISQTSRDNFFKGSILWIFDKTKTSMGARLLSQWLNQPLLNINNIKKRQLAVFELVNDLVLREELMIFLKNVFDLERINSRIISNKVSPKDLIALAESIAIFDELISSLSNVNSKFLLEIKNSLTKNFKNEFLSLSKIKDLINNCLVENPPHNISEGGIIKDGFNQSLDEYRQITKGSKTWLLEFENKERQKTGIKNLKISFNKVFGYYLEISKGNLDKVPQDYIRKQTIANGERFITPELKEKENLILNAKEVIFKLEQDIFQELRKEIAKASFIIQETASAIAQLDCLLSLAEVAVSNNYICPEIFEAQASLIEIKNGRHPVIEKTIGQNLFVPNDFILKQGEFMVLTGPNMSGKSTYMRQIAIIILLAQIGSFVPADSAKISIVDRIFTRVGAIDDIYLGQSTFMVEMTETANIVNNATAFSFIVLDELGRGTSTYDGLSLAWSVAEYIFAKIGAKTIFATHYQELTEMSKHYPKIKNYNVKVDETNGKITFLHRVEPGAASKSYGIHVAELAGLPTEILKRAKIILKNMENSHDEILAERQLKLL